ncbi:MAG: cation:proton antiporter [Planctomycetota bacterium]
MTPLVVLIVASALLGYGLIARRLDSSMVTAPMLFAGIGWAVGSGGTGLVHVEADSHAVRHLVEATLVLVLFTDASRVRFSSLRRHFGLPLRLLAIGLPLAVLGGGLAARWVLPGLDWEDALLLGAMLAPTDAALGQSVVTNPAVPGRIRQALNVESGLNDGISVPIFATLLTAAVIADGASGTGEGGGWGFALRQLALGPLMGAAVGGAGGWLVERALERGTSTPATARIAALGLAFGAHAAAGLVGGNGLIAAFVAGLVVGNLTRHAPRALLSFAEAEGRLLALVAFLLFGAALVPFALPRVDLRVALYVGLSLTVVRLAPVALATLGLRLSAPSVLFLGWFGPRGLATVLFALAVRDEDGLRHADTLCAIATATVGVSVLAHGATAAGWSAAYGRWSEALRSRTPAAAECQTSSGLPTRFGTSRNGKSS